VDSLISPLGGIGVGTETLEAILGTADVDALELAGWELGEKHFIRARAALAGLGEDLGFQRYRRDIGRVGMVQNRHQQPSET
jgi:hypothetical protein